MPWLLEAVLTSILTLNEDLAHDSYERVEGSMAQINKTEFPHLGLIMRKASEAAAPSLQLNMFC